VHSETGRYRSLKQNEQFEAMQIAFEGEDFFSIALQQVKRLIVQEDWDKVSQALSRNYLEEELEKSGRYLVDYRMTIGGKVQYMRLSVSWATDRLHMIFAVENIDEEIRREKARVEAMQKANQLARKDALTGAKNKNAYIEAERALQEMVDAEGTQFGVVVCDLNNLKRINDLKGHNTGDEYIRQAYRMICTVFSHKPKFSV
jgi:predicted signal transduction protein with EAL and GGDEF domain